jgi:hypothetical protein
LRFGRGVSGSFWLRFEASITYWKCLEAYVIKNLKFGGGFDGFWILRKKGKNGVIWRSELRRFLSCSLSARALKLRFYLYGRIRSSGIVVCESEWGQNGVLFLRYFVLFWFSFFLFQKMVMSGIGIEGSRFMVRCEWDGKFLVPFLWFFYHFWIEIINNNNKNARIKTCMKELWLCEVFMDKKWKEKGLILMF